MHQPTDEIYRLANEALWNWVSSQEDIDNLWENTEESSRVVVDAIWEHINNLD